MLGRKDLFVVTWETTNWTFKKVWVLYSALWLIHTDRAQDRDPLQAPNRSIALCRNVHIGSRQGLGWGFIVFYCASSIPCLSPVPIPVAVWIYHKTSQKNVFMSLLIHFITWIAFYTDHIGCAFWTLEVQCIGTRPLTCPSKPLGPCYVQIR